MRLLRSACLVASFAVAPACKRKTDDVFVDALAKMRAFTDEVCACRDKACAEKVQEELTKWSQELAYNERNRKAPPPSEQEMKDVAAVGQRYAECAEKVRGVGATDDPLGTDPPTPAPPAERITNADRLIKHTFDTLGAHAVASLVLSYVRADGTIDDTYGEAEVDLGIPAPPAPGDDPARPIGAPLVDAAVPPVDPDARCPTTRWKHGTPAVTMAGCGLFGPALARPRCSVVEIWRRAIEKGAPASALAVLELHGGTPQSWSFRIDDAPREIHIAIDVEDTCAPTLERP